MPLTSHVSGSCRCQPDTADGIAVQAGREHPARALSALRAQGHDVETAGSEGLAGAVDAVILAACTAEDRVLITLDLDFSDIRAYPPGSHKGIWVLRPTQQTFDAVVALVEAAFRLSSVERTAGQLWVVDERRVRIRE